MYCRHFWEWLYYSSSVENFFQNFDKFPSSYMESNRIRQKSSVGWNGKIHDQNNDAPSVVALNNKQWQGKRVNLARRFYSDESRNVQAVAILKSSKLDIIFKLRTRFFAFYILGSCSLILLFVYGSSNINTTLQERTVDSSIPNLSVKTLASQSIVIW